MRAISLAFTPGFESVASDPGSGNTIHIIRGPISDGELSQMLGLWNEAAPLLVTLNATDWQDLLNTVHEWVYPEMITNADIHQSTKEIMQRMAKQMVTDILDASKDRPGVQLWAR